MDIWDYKKKYGSRTTKLVVERYIFQSPTFPRDTALAAQLGTMMAELETALNNLPEKESEDLMSKTLYERLIEAGVPEHRAEKLVLKHVIEGGDLIEDLPPGTEQKRPLLLTGESSSEIVDVQFSEGGRRGGRPLDPTAANRVLAYVLLWVAYTEANSTPVEIDYIHRQMKTIYDFNAKIWEPISDDYLANLLTNLRYGRIKGLPSISTNGPGLYNIKGKRQEGVLIHPRDFFEDIQTYELPEWLVARVKQKLGKTS